MRGLPGEDRAVNNITETHLRQLFDTGHGKAGAGAGDTALQEAGAVRAKWSWSGLLRAAADS